MSRVSIEQLSALSPIDLSNLHEGHGHFFLEALDEIIDRAFVDEEIEMTTRLTFVDKFYMMRECVWETIKAYEFAGHLYAAIWVNFSNARKSEDDNKSDKVFSFVTKFCEIMKGFGCAPFPNHCKVFQQSMQYKMGDLVPKEFVGGNKVYIVDCIYGKRYSLTVDSEAIKPELIKYDLNLPKKRKIFYT